MTYFCARDLSKIIFCAIDNYKVQCFLSTKELGHAEINFIRNLEEKIRRVSVNPTGPTFLGLL